MKRYVVSTYTRLREQRIVEAENEQEIRDWADAGELDEYCDGPHISELEELEIADITEIPMKKG